MDHSLELQLSSISSSSSSLSLESPPLTRYSANNAYDGLAKELERMPVPFMINELDQMCHCTDLVQLQRSLLVNPYNVSKILRSDPNARTKLTIYFQWLEKSSDDFVWTLVKNITSITRKTDLSDGHLLGFHSMLKLGTFLMETGWYAESIIVLNIAKDQARRRPIKILQVFKILILAESFSNREEAAFITISQIHTLVGMTTSVPLGLTAEIHCSLASSYFENCEFNSSYQQGLLALQLLREGTCPSEVVVGTFRQLGKSCLAKRRPVQAKLLITQAVSWAWHTFGSSSVIYAETLEDYAFYLLMMNSYGDAVRVVTEAKHIYYTLYGHLGLQAETAQGNLAFRMYLENQKFHELGPIDQYIDYIGDMEDERRKIAVTRSDDRQMLAVRRMRSIMAVKELYKDEQRALLSGLIENVQPQDTVKEVRRIFFNNFVR